MKNAYSRASSGYAIATATSAIAASPEENRIGAFAGPYA
jgi:hypothetical protein